MRLIGTIKDEIQARKFCESLTNAGIENQWELITNTDWGSAEYGDRACRIWITDEDQLEQTTALFNAFMQNPEDPRFGPAAPDPLSQSTLRPAFDAFTNARHRLQQAQESVNSYQTKPLGPITLSLILTCTLLFFWTVWSSILPSAEEDKELNLPKAGLVTSPIKRTLLYDFPAAYQLLDQFLNLVKENQWTSEKQITPAGLDILNQFNRTSYWRGFYDVLVKYLRHEDWTSDFVSPKFEKIRDGELWRIETPVFLHNDLLHLLFNMLWLVVLGRQLEPRLGTLRYVAFCLIVGAFSNTAQYLMSGPNFLGFSGILCGMLAYIWVRQKRAPWEGYFLQTGTFGFLTVFILAMVGIQLFSFFNEAFWGGNPFGYMANTAHLSGALAGYILGYVPYFSWGKP